MTSLICRIEENNPKNLFTKQKQTHGCQKQANKQTSNVWFLKGDSVCVGGEINQEFGRNIHTLVVLSLSRVRLFATPWTVAHEAPPSMGFSRQEYWSGLPFPSPGDLPDPGIEPWSPALQADALPSKPPGKHTAIQKTISKDLLYSTEDSPHYSIIIYMRKSEKQIDICMCVYIYNYITLLYT